MDSCEEVVLLLASDIRFESIWSLADAMVTRVFNATCSNMLDNTDSKPDIGPLCEQFRAEMKRLNLAVPDDDTALYTKVAQPLASIRRWRSV